MQVDETILHFLHDYDSDKFMEVIQLMFLLANRTWQGCVDDSLLGESWVTIQVDIGRHKAECRIEATT